MGGGEERNQPPECRIPVQSCWRTGIVRAKRGPRVFGMVQSKAIQGGGGG